MNKYYQNLFFLFLIFALSNSNAYCSEDYCKLSDRIVSQYSKELKKTRGLYLTGSGGAMMQDIEKIMIDYTSQAKLTVPEARKLYVEIAEEYLNRINNDQKIRPYLHNYPFNISNIDLRISFVDSNGHFRTDKLVAFVSHGKKKRIYYDVYSEDKLQDFYEEPYSEALRIVYGRTCNEGTSENKPLIPMPELSSESKVMTQELPQPVNTFSPCESASKIGS